MSRDATRLRPNSRQLVLVAFIVAGVYVLLPRFGSFHSSWTLIENARPVLIIAAAALTFATYIAAAGTYRFLAFKPIGIRQTTLVQLAAMFVNRLLPAGLGGLGINYLYLRKRRHTVAQAVTVAGTNNVIGFVGHSMLLTVAFVFAGHALSRPAGHITNKTLLLEGIVVALAITVIGLLVYGRQKAAALLHDIRKQLFSYRTRPASLAGALTTSLLLTTCNVLCLYACLQALSITLPLPVVLVVLSFGVGAGAVVPTPGGLGGFEAGIAAGLAAYGATASQALAAAILYRMVSYWLPMVAGLISLIACERKGLFGASG